MLEVAGPFPCVIVSGPSREVTIGRGVDVAAGTNTPEPGAGENNPIRRCCVTHVIGRNDQSAPATITSPEKLFAVLERVVVGAPPMLRLLVPGDLARVSEVRVGRERADRAAGRPESDRPGNCQVCRRGAKIRNIREDNAVAGARVQRDACTWGAEIGVAVKVDRTRC